MSDDLPARLRGAFRLVDASVAVVTSAVGASHGAMTVTAFTTVSLDPPTILVCVNRSSRIHPLIVASGAYRLNILTDAQAKIARARGGGDLATRFEQGRWHVEAPYGPRLDGALASVGCALCDIIDRGSHTVFIGAVDDLATSEERPLLYAKGDYVGARA